MTDTINTRELIMNILLEMDREKTPCHLAVRDALDKYQFLPRQDRAFIKRVCEGTVEYGIQNDYIINQYSKIKINKCKPVIRAILRMSVYQIRFLDAVPDSAVVNEAVKLAEKKHFYNLKGFVNGVLRTIVREKDHLPMPKENNTTQYLSVKYSMPEFLVEEFVSQYGKETAETMMADFLKEKQVTIRINRWNNTIEETKKSLESQGAELEKAPYLGEAFYLKNFETIASLNAFQEGRFQIQDVSSMMVAETVAPKKDSYIIDVCAAPGGKSVHLAEKLGGTGMVEARDLTEYKTDLIRQNIARHQLSNMRAVQMDATVLDEASIGKADVVIADLPCSGLGVMRRKTDIKYKMTLQTEQELVSLQRNMLETVCQYVKVGGTLLYSTCTMDKMENEDNVTWFLKQHPQFELVKMQQIFPQKTYGDGFFLAKLQKKA